MTMSGINVIDVPENVYTRVKLVLDLPPANYRLQEAMMNMMKYHKESWNDLIYGQLIGSDSSKTQSLPVGSNEDMIVSMLVTARYNVITDSRTYILLVTQDIPIFSGVAPLSSCSSDSKFKVMYGDTDDMYCFKLTEGKCAPYVDRELAIGMKLDEDDRWIIDMVTSNQWIVNSELSDSCMHKKITVVNVETIKQVLKENNIDPETFKQHIYNKKLLVDIGVVAVDATSI
jgi:hypothetical protein